MQRRNRYYERSLLSVVGRQRDDRHVAQVFELPDEFRGAKPVEFRQAQVRNWGSQINIWGMVVHMWRDYFLWILGTFIVVSALRLLLVLLLARKTNAQPSKVDAAPNKSLDARGGSAFRKLIGAAKVE